MEELMVRNASRTGFDTSLMGSRQNIFEQKDNILKDAHGFELAILGGDSDFIFIEIKNIIEETWGREEELRERWCSLVVHMLNVRCLQVIHEVVSHGD